MVRDSFQKYGNPGLRPTAIDIGCSVGRSSFELSSWCDQVVGVDFSDRFISGCKALQAGHEIAYTAPLEGELVTSHLARVPPTARPDRCSFEQGDACMLRPDIGRFGALLAANLICRLPDPAAFLRRTPTLVEPGGVMVLLTPWTWLPEYTTRDKWLGGFPTADSGAARSGETLIEILTEVGFELVEKGEMPFVIRESFRKNQLTSSQLTVWKRTST